MDWRISRIQLGVVLFVAILAGGIAYYALSQMTTILCIVGPCPQPPPAPSLYLFAGILAGVITYLSEFVYNNRKNS